MKQFKGMLIGAIVTLLIGAVFVIAGVSLPPSGLKNGMFLLAAVFGLTAIIVLFPTYQFYNKNKAEIKQDQYRAKQMHAANRYQKTADMKKKKNGGVSGFEIPNLFTDKYKYDDEEIETTVKRFNRNFGLTEYRLPNGFLEFVNAKGFTNSETGWIEIQEDLCGIEPIPYDDILESAYNVLYGSDVFDFPPLCVPFAIDESGHNLYYLDYRKVGKQGEPRIISVDNELDIEFTDNEDITTYTFRDNCIADNFDAFLKLCGFERTVRGDVVQELFRLKNAKISDVRILPAAENFSEAGHKKANPFLPDDYLAFLRVCGGIDSHTFGLSGVNRQPGADYYPLAEKQQYLDGYGKGYRAEDWFFIGGDGMGGEYAFSTTKQDGKVYYFDHESPGELRETRSFIEFLTAEITMLIDSGEDENEEDEDMETNDSVGMDDDEYDRLSKDAAAYNYDADKRCFSLTDDKSDKFWHINRIGEFYYVHYGKNGTFGRIEVKEAESEEACEKFVAKTIAEKTGKGYVEVKGEVIDDKFEQAKAGCRPALDSMYIMFSEDEPLIYIAAIKAACERFCDIMRLAAGDDDKIKAAVKAVASALNQYADAPGIIETEEREILGPWTDEVAVLAGYEDPDDLAGEWREW